MKSMSKTTLIVSIAALLVIFALAWGYVERGGLHRGGDMYRNGPPPRPTTPQQPDAATVKAFQEQQKNNKRPMMASSSMSGKIELQ